MTMATEVTALNAPLASTAATDLGTSYRRAAASAGVVYLGAWLAGLLAAPAGPTPHAEALTVHEYFVAHHHAALNQSYLVHGLGGVALVVLAVALWRSFADVPRSLGLRVLLVGAGIAAALASFVQLGYTLRINHHISKGVGVRVTDSLFDGLNQAGSMKLILLAVAVGATSVLAARAHAFRRWVEWLGYALVAVLPLAALAFVLEGRALATVLSVSLPLLMLWVAAASAALYRRPLVQA
jgi:hypothetical protein